MRSIHRSLLCAASALALVSTAAPAQAGGPAKPAGSAQPADAAAPFGIAFRADTLVLAPVLNVGLVEAERTVVAGERATFIGYSNYPAFVARGEVRVLRAGESPDAEPLAVLPTDADGTARWDVPADAPEAMFYVFRVYDADGRFDETHGQDLRLVARRADDDGRPGRPDFGAVDEAARRTIPLDGLMATVTGRADPATDSVRVGGQAVPLANDGRFAAQQIVPREGSGLDVVVTRNGVEAARVAQSFAAPRDDWFVVGQGDLTLGRSFGSGPAETVSGDPAAAGGFATGRAAFYAKGVVADEWRVTAALDTGEAPVADLLSNLDRKDPGQLLRRLNREQYYPTYGDNSTLVEDAPTQGRFYVRVAKADSQLVVGNFVTAINGAELAQLDRGLFGALLDLNSDGVTSFGERRAQLTAFASDPGTVPGREEFRGTGGSLYFLRRQDVSTGSERVRVEIRDRDTGLVLEARELHPQQDYDFDPLQGRLTLLRPLPSVVADGGVVRDGSAPGNIPVLVVRYEYSPAVGSLDGYTLGGRASGWLGEHVRLAATAQRDTTEDAAQTLLGADLLVRLAAGTYAKAEVARTDGPAFGEAYSADGGLSFADIANPGLLGAAWAYRAEAAADFAEMAGRAGDRGKLSAFYENYDAGFASAGRLSPAATTRWGARVAVPLNADGGSVAGSWEEISSASIGTARTGTLDLAQRFGAVTGKLGLRHEDREPGVLVNSIAAGSRTDAALQVEYALSPSNALYAFGQATLDRDAARDGNNRMGVGARSQLTDRLSFDGELSGGDGGLGANARLNRDLGEGSEAYVGYALLTDRTDTGLEPINLLARPGEGTLTVGTRKRFSDALSVYGENRVGFGERAPSLSRSFGLTFEPSAGLSVSGSFENGQIEDITLGLFRRTAGSLSVGYVADGLRLGSAVEARFEEGAGRDQTVWLFRNDASVAVDPDWTALARLNIARADNDGPSLRAADFTEAVAGLAWRPIGHERTNALLRFTYFEDLGPVGQFTGSGTAQSPRQVSTVVSVDANHDLTQRLTLGLKYGYRQGRVSLGRESDTFVGSDAHLGVARLDYAVTRAWDVLVEGRALHVEAADETRLGALGAVYRHLGNNVKLGAGYSLSDFSDDLTDQSYSSHGPFVNLLGKF